MTPVTEYVKNLGKSFKYATFKYLEREAPAITEFTNTNEELFRDTFHSIRDLKGTYRKAARAIQSTNIYQVGNTAFENALSDLKSGKFYNKEREDKAMNDSFGFEDGEMDMSMDNFDQEGSAPSMSAGERAIGSAVTSSSARSASRVAGTVEASARYMVENAKANTNMLYQQMTNTNNIMSSGFKGMMSGLDTLNQFNNTVMKTLAENSIEFFQRTTNIMQENNAIFKEMLEMQRNLYKNAQTQPGMEDEETDPLNAVMGAYGTPDLKKYGKEVMKNMKRLLSEKSGGMTDMIDEEMLKMMAANPLQAIPGFVMSAAMGPVMKTAIKNIGETLRGAFGTFVSKMVYKAKNSGSLGSEIMGKLFGIHFEDKSHIDTDNYKKQGPIPFDWATKRAIIEVIPGYLSRIEAALTGNAAKVYDDKTGQWTNMKRLKKDFLSEKESYEKSGSYDEMNEMRSIMQNAKLSSTIQKNVEDAMNKIASKRFADGGWLDLSGSNLDKSIRYGVDPKTMQVFESLYKQVSKQTKMNTSADILRNKNEYRRLLKTREEEGNNVYKNLFSGMDTSNSLTYGAQDISETTEAIGKAFDLTKMKDSYNKTIFDYLRAIEMNTANGGATSKGKFSKISNINSNLTTGIRSSAAQSDRYVSYDETPGLLSDAELSHAMSNINKAGKAFQLQNRAAQLEENRSSLTGFMDNAIKELKYSRSADATVDKEVKSGLSKILNAASLGEKFEAIGSSLEKLTQKPSAALSGVIEQADNHIYNMLFEEEDDKDISDILKSKDGKKAKGFLGKLQQGLSNIFDTMKKNMDENDAAHRASMFDVADKTMKDLLGFNMTEIKDATLDMGKKMLSDSFNAVKSDTMSVFDKTKQFFAETEEQDTPQYYNKKLDKKYKTLNALSEGTRNVTKTGLVMLSKGERVIPSDENIYNPNMMSADRNRDAANEEAMKKDLVKQMGGPLNLAKSIPGKANGGTIGGEAEPGVVKRNVKVLKEKFGKGKKALYSKLGIQTAEEAPEAMVSKISTATDQFLVGMFGEEDSKEIKKATKQATAEVKEHMPNVAAGGILGLVGGSLIGGPLMGAMLGSAVSIASNSETIQKALFGEKILDENGKDTGKRKGGFISQATQEAMKKYLPDMKNYGIAGMVGGLITPLGPLGGLMLGSAIGFCKNNETVQKMLFGENGLINDETKKTIKKYFPNAAKGAAGAMVLSTIMTGGFSLPVALAGAGLGIVASTDEFKDFLLGQEDENGNRYGGLAQSIRDGVLDPLKNLTTTLRDNFVDWFKDDMVKPIADAMAPLGKTIELGMKGALDTIGGAVAKLFSEDSGIPFLSSIRYGIIGKGIGKGGGLLGGVTKGAGYALSRPSAMIGALGDRQRAKHIQSGNATYMTAAERRNFMGKRGKSDYNHRQLDDMLAGSTVEELEAMKDEFGALSKGKGYFDNNVKSLKSGLGKKVIGIVKDTARAEKIMEAVESGDVKRAQNLVMEAQNISTSDKKKLTDIITKEGNQLRTAMAKRDNYQGNRDKILKELKKKGFKNINEKNIDTYSKLFSTELTARKKAMGVGKDKKDVNPEDKVANSITTSLDSNFNMLLPLVQQTNELLEEIRQDGGRLDGKQKRRLKKQNKTANKYGNKRIRSLEKSRDKRASKIRSQFGSKKLTEKNKDMLMDDDLYDRMRNIGDYEVDDLNTVLELDPKLRNRYLTLAEHGYKVNDIEELKGFSEREFKRLSILTKAGIKLNDLQAVKDMDESTAKYMAEMYKGGVKNVSQGTLQNLAQTSGGVFVDDKEARKKILKRAKKKGKGENYGGKENKAFTRLKKKKFLGLFSSGGVANADGMAIVSQGERIEAAKSAKSYLDGAKKKFNDMEDNASEALKEIAAASKAQVSAILATGGTKVEGTGYQPQTHKNGKLFSAEKGLTMDKSIQINVVDAINVQGENITAVLRKILEVVTPQKKKSLTGISMIDKPLLGALDAIESKSMLAAQNRITGKVEKVYDFVGNKIGAGTSKIANFFGFKSNANTNTTTSNSSENGLKSFSSIEVPDILKIHSHNMQYLLTKIYEKLGGSEDELEGHKSSDKKDEDVSFIDSMKGFFNNLKESDLGKMISSVYDKSSGMYKQNREAGSGRLISGVKALDNTGVYYGNKAINGVANFVDEKEQQLVDKVKNTKYGKMAVDKVNELDQAGEKLVHDISQYGIDQYNQNRDAGSGRLMSGVKALDSTGVYYGNKAINGVANFVDGKEQQLVDTIKGTKYGKMAVDKVNELDQAGEKLANSISQYGIDQYNQNRDAGSGRLMSGVKALDNTGVYYGNKAIEGVSNIVSNNTRKLIDKAKDTELGKKVITGVEWVDNKADEGIHAFSNAVSKLIKEYYNLIKENGKIKGSKEFVKKYGQKALDYLKNNKLLKKVEEKSSDVKDSISEKYNEAKGMLSEKIGNIVDNMKAETEQVETHGLGGLISKATASFVSKGEAIVSAGTKYAGTAKEAIKNKVKKKVSKTGKSEDTDMKKMKELTTSSTEYGNLQYTTGTDGKPMLQNTKENEMIKKKVENRDNIQIQILETLKKILDGQQAPDIEEEKKDKNSIWGLLGSLLAALLPSNLMKYITKIKNAVTGAFKVGKTIFNGISKGVSLVGKTVSYVFKGTKTIMKGLGSILGVFGKVGKAVGGKRGLAAVIAAAAALKSWAFNDDNTAEAKDNDQDFDKQVEGENESGEITPEDTTNENNSMANTALNTFGGLAMAGTAYNFGKNVMSNGKQAIKNKFDSVKYALGFKPKNSAESTVASTKEETPKKTGFADKAYKGIVAFSLANTLKTKYDYYMNMTDEEKAAYDKEQENKSLLEDVFDYKFAFDGVKSVYDMTKPLTNKITDKITPDSGTFKSILKKIKNGFDTTISSLKNFISEKFVNGLKALREIIIETAKNPAKVGKIMKSAAKLAGKALVVGGTLGLGAIVLGAYEAGMAVSNFYDGYNDAANTLGINPELETTPIKIIAGLINAIYKFVPFLDCIWETPSEFKDVVLDTVGKAVGITKETIEKMNKDANKAATDIQKELSSTINETSEKAQEIEKEAEEYKNSTWQNIKNGVNNGIQWAKDKANSAYVKTKQVLGSMYNGAKDMASSAWNKTKSFFGFGSGKFGRGGLQQDDPAWANMPMQVPGDTYGQTIGDRACLQFSMANAIPGLDPFDAINYSVKNGYVKKDDGTDPNAAINYINKYTNSTAKFISPSQMSSYVKDPNHKVIAMGEDNTNTKELDAAGLSNTPYADPHYVTFDGSNGNNIHAIDPQSSGMKDTFNSSTVTNKTSKAIAIDVGGKGKFQSKNAKFAKDLIYGKSESLTEGDNNGKGKFGRGPTIDENPPFASVASTIASKVGSKHPELFWAQMMFETGGPEKVKADIAKIGFDDYNYGGFTWYDGMGEEYKGAPRPSNEGGYYAKFKSDAEYADMAYNKVYKKYQDQIKDCATPEDFAKVLKANGYFASSESEYATGLKSILNANKDKIGNIKGAQPLSGGGSGTYGGNTSSSENKYGGLLGGFNKVIDVLTQAIFGGGESSSQSGGGSGSYGSNSGTVSPGSTEGGNKVIEAARSYLPKMGGPGHYSQDASKRENPDGGTSDCSGFVNSIYRKVFGSDVATKNGFSGNGDSQMRGIPGAAFSEDNKATAGDVVFMTTKYGGTSSSKLKGDKSSLECDHVGLVVNGAEGKMIDIGSNTTGLTERSWNSDWITGHSFIHPDLLGNGSNTTPQQQKQGKGKFGRGANDATTNKPRIWNWLLSKGLNNAQAAGVMGNIQQESNYVATCLQSWNGEAENYDSLEPPEDINNDRAWGLFQMTNNGGKQGGRLNNMITWIKSQNKAPGDLGAQLEWTYNEAQQRKDWEKLTSAQTATDACNAWSENYERCGVGGSRVSYANKVLQEYGQGQADGKTPVENGVMPDTAGLAAGGANSGGNNNGGGGLMGPLNMLLNSVGDAIAKELGISTGGNSGGSQGGNGGPVSANIKSASDWAKQMAEEGKNKANGFGNNGCTEFVRQYLNKANHPLGQMMTNNKFTPEGNYDNNNPMWVPALYSYAKANNIWKEASQGGAEGDVAILETNHNKSDGPDHVVIAQGNGNYWGNSSSANAIKEGSIAGHYGEDAIYGYISTGSGASSVSKGELTRSKEEIVGDAGSTSASGKWGRGTILNGSILKSSDIKYHTYEDAMNAIKLFDINQIPVYNRPSSEDSLLVLNKKVENIFKRYTPTIHSNQPISQNIISQIKQSRSNYLHNRNGKGKFGRGEVLNRLKSIGSIWSGVGRAQELYKRHKSYDFSDVSGVDADSNKYSIPYLVKKYNLQFDDMGNLKGVDIPEYNRINGTESLQVKYAKQRAQIEYYAKNTYKSTDSIVSANKIAKNIQNKDEKALNPDKKEPSKSTGIKFLDMGLKSLGLDYDYNKAKKKKLERLKEAQNKSSKEKAMAGSNEDQAKEIAPNGIPYSENDIKYLMEQSKSWPNPLTREQAIEYLSKEEKYTKKIEKEDINTDKTNTQDYTSKIKATIDNLKKQYAERDTRVKEKDIEKQIIDPNKKANDRVKEEIAPNGKPYSENDIKYLMNMGKTREEAIKILSKHEKYSNNTTPLDLTSQQTPSTPAIDYTEKFDAMIELLGVIASAMSGKQINTDNMRKNSNEYKQSTNGKAANQVTQNSIQDSFANIAQAMNSLAAR